MNPALQTAPDFRRVLRRSAAVHGLVLSVVTLAFFLQGCFHARKPREIVTFIDLQSAEMVAEPEPLVKMPDLAPTPPVQPPEPPEPVEPDPIPDKVPPPRANKIEVSKVRIRNPQVTPPPVQKSTRLTKAQIEAELKKSLGRAAPGPGREMDAWDAYCAYVMQVMYATWQQPTDGSVPAGSYVMAQIRVDRAGNLIRRNITRRSGHAIMDQSVDRALATVNGLRALPPEIAGPYRDISIRFDLEREF